MKCKFSSGIATTLVFIFTLLFQHTKLLAQGPEWINYPYVEQDRVWAIALDSQYAWCGTYQGVLVRVDKVSHEYFTFDSTNSPLGESRITAITIAESGTKWIGTSSGSLYAYNGEDWTEYNSTNSSLTGTNISSIVTGRDGKIWVGCDWGGENEGGLYVFDGTDWSEYLVTNSDLPSNTIFCLTYGVDGKLWIGTYDGLASFDGNTWDIFNTSTSGIPSNEVLSIAIENDSIIWVGTDGGGLASYDGNSWNVFNVENSELPRNCVSDLNIDENGVKWFISFWDWMVGGEHWFVSFDDTTWQFFDESNTELTMGGGNGFEMDDAGTLWIGMEYVDLFAFNNPTCTRYKFLDSGISGDKVSSIAIDSSGNKWFTARPSGGVCSYDGTVWRNANTTSSISLPHTAYLEILCDVNGNYWALAGSWGFSGSWNGLLSSNDGIDWTLYPADELPTDIRAIATDSAGTLWTGGYGELASFDGVNWSIYPCNFDICEIAIDGAGTKWMLTPHYSGGLIALTRRGWSQLTTSNSGLASNDLHSIAISPDGVVWLGGRGNLTSFDGMHWQVHDTDQAGLDDRIIRDIAFDASGKVWLAATDRGLTSYDGSDWVVYNTGNSEIPGNWINSIAIESNGNIWMGFDGQGAAVFNETGIVVGIDDVGKEAMSQPSNICLKQNYPNPFNPSTTITYSLPEAGEVELLIYDLQGRMVDKLFSGPQSAGTHDILWNGVNQNGFPISSGVYLCKLLAGEYIKTIKMVYLR